jgi:hypothetical protein
MPAEAAQARWMESAILNLFSARSLLIVCSCHRSQKFAQAL